MMFRVLAAAGVATILAVPSSVNAQVLMQRELSARMAITIAEAAWTECTARVSVAVVDRAGRMKALIVGDGISPHNIELAERKAYTARTFGRTSIEWAQRTETQTQGQRSLAKVIPLQEPAEAALLDAVGHGPGGRTTPRLDLTRLPDGVYRLRTSVSALGAWRFDISSRFPPGSTAITVKVTDHSGGSRAIKTVSIEGGLQHVDSYWFGYWCHGGLHASGLCVCGGRRADAEGHHVGAGP